MHNKEVKEMKLENATKQLKVYGIAETIMIILAAIMIACGFIKPDFENMLNASQSALICALYIETMRQNIKNAVFSDVISSLLDVIHGLEKKLEDKE